MPPPDSSLLTPADVRALASKIGIRPTKTLGQNFVIDPNTVRRIVRTAAIASQDVVLEVGPGLGSLTLGLLEVARAVVAVEIDVRLADLLADTVASRDPRHAPGLTVVAGDALRVDALPGPPPTALVANLPYNVAVPVLLHLLATFPSIERSLVMVQAEVAERLAAGPGSRVYGVPSAKARWFGDVSRAGNVGRTVFWPVPNVDSGLVSVLRRPPPPEWAGVAREDVFAVIDAAFSQRRKMLRSALATWAGGTAPATQILEQAGVRPTERGEALGLDAFVRIAAVGRHA